MMLGKRRKYLQYRLITSRWTLPISIVIAVLYWLLSVNHSAAVAPSPSDHFLVQWLPLWSNYFLSFAISILIASVLIVANNTFALIRVRTTFQATVYILLTAACPVMHTLHAGSVAVLCYLLAIFLLFRNYQHPNPTGSMFHIFLLFGVGSFCFPQLTWLLPIIWIGAYRFQELSIRSFFASLLGWSFPYWLLFGHAYFYGQMEMFYQPFTEMFAVSSWQFEATPYEWMFYAYIMLLFLISATHIIVSGNEDKLRTRNFLSFLVSIHFYIILCVLLQPQHIHQWLPLLLPGVAVQIAHLFVLTGNRISNIFFLSMLISLITLFTYTLWMLF